MALRFSSLINRSFLYMGLGAVIPLRAGNVVSSFSVYKGSRPSAAAIAAAWSPYNSGNCADFLAHYNNSYLIFNNQTPYNLVVLNTPLPTTNAALRAGLATWAIIWPTNYTTAQVAAATIPSTSFLVIDVGAFGSNAIMTFDNPTFSVGENKQVASINITSAIIGG